MYRHSQLCCLLSYSRITGDSQKQASVSESGFAEFSQSDGQKQRSVSESGFAESAESSLEPPFCLYIKTELCDEATLKTWLDDCSVHNWKREDVIDFFMEVFTMLIRMKMGSG